MCLCVLEGKKEERTKDVSYCCLNAKHMLIDFARQKRLVVVSITLNSKQSIHFYYYHRHSVICATFYFTFMRWARICVELLFAVLSVVWLFSDKIKINHQRILHVFGISKVCFWLLAKHNVLFHEFNFFFLSKCEDFGLLKF